MRILFRETTFIKSAAELSQLVLDEGREVAFAGRSNAGKSTALNVITGVKQLARTSKTPGRTQLINFFGVDNSNDTNDNYKIRLVDLPGYGYAKVPLAIKLNWEKTLSRYLQTRESLRGLCLLIDSRHPFQPFDRHMLQWAQEAELPIHILFSKADKLTQSEKSQLLKMADKTLNIDIHKNIEERLISFQLFSALRHEGIEEARKKISQWLLPSN